MSKKKFKLSKAKKKGSKIVISALIGMLIFSLLSFLTPLSIFFRVIFTAIKELIILIACFGVIVGSAITGVLVVLMF